MDEPEVIPRREAVVGLGLLGLFTAALVGTVLFRIVQATPKRAPQTPATVWASQEPASPLTDEAALTPGEPQLAAEISPPAAPIPTIDDGASSVPVSSNVSQPEPTTAPPASEHTPAPTLPYFVAPSAR